MSTLIDAVHLCAPAFIGLGDSHDDAVGFFGLEGALPIALDATLSVRFGGGWVAGGDCAGPDGVSVRSRRTVVQLALNRSDGLGSWAVQSNFIWKSFGVRRMVSYGSAERNVPWSRRLSVQSYKAAEVDRICILDFA